MVVQTVVMLAVLATTELAPTTLLSVPESFDVESVSGINLVLERNASQNVFIGPAKRDVIRLGAMYPPCMRADAAHNMSTSTPERDSEERVGCCIRGAGSSCHNAMEEDCLGLAFWSNQSCQSAICCEDPADYPGCLKKDAASLGPESEYDLCRCEIIARPCCTEGGKCEILPEAHCYHHHGVYHQTARLCSEVDCLGDICGLSNFAKPAAPDQWYRLLLAPFLHVGVVHLLTVLNVEMTLGWDMERAMGWWRFAGVWLSGGIGGYLFSGLITPDSVDCGGTPALFGLLGCLLVELGHSWRAIRAPWTQLAKHLSLVSVALFFGTLPYVNNWAHVGGFLFGGVAGWTFLPWRAFDYWDRASKRFFGTLALASLVVAFAALLSIFFAGIKAECAWCQQFNCINFVEDFCLEGALV